MKNIDIKSVIIGVLLTTTLFFGMGATRPTDKWDDKQLWELTRKDGHDSAFKNWYPQDVTGWEPFAYDQKTQIFIFRKRIK